METKSITVRAFLKDANSGKCLVPSLQRPFVWPQQKITQLFDSLMRGYPIGTILVWRTKKVDNPKLQFRSIMCTYEGPASQPPVVHPKQTDFISAVLDGQQRAGALNIGLHGSWAGSSHAAAKMLYIDLDTDRADAGAEINRYEFKFRLSADEDEAWFPVAEAVGLKTGVPDLDKALRANHITPNSARRRVLKRLVTVVNVEAVIDIKTVSDDLDDVLSIFARTNMAGTPLTYVDLLMSTAATKMTIDLKKEFEVLRSNVRQHGFSLSIDRILKTCFVLLKVKDAKFHAVSLMENAKQLEAEWPAIAQSLEVAAGLLKSFGLSERTLAAENAMIVAAAYAYHKGWKPTHVTADSTESQRKALKAFLSRTLLIRGYWTGAVDPVLIAANDVFRKNSATKPFPVSALEDAVAKAGKSVAIEANFVDTLLDLEYGERRTLVLLSLLYPHMPLGHPLQRDLAKDHIFPMSRFSESSLSTAKVPRAMQPVWRYRANQLPNLQLLGGTDNTASKRAKLPSTWWSELSKTQRKRYTLQRVSHLPPNLTEFMSFWEKRREHLRVDINALLMTKP